MSSTVRAPYLELGLGGDYPVIGQEAASLKGGQRTNFHGEVPILDGDKKQVGWAEITKIVSARPKFMPLGEIEACGFTNIDEAIEYAKREHGEEYERDGVLTVFHYKVVKLNNI